MTARYERPAVLGLERWAPWDQWTWEMFDAWGNDDAAWLRRAWPWSVPLWLQGWGVRLSREWISGAPVARSDTPHGDLQMWLEGWYLESLRPPRPTPEWLVEWMEQKGRKGNGKGSAKSGKGKGNGPPKRCTRSLFGKEAKGTEQEKRTHPGGGTLDAPPPPGIGAASNRKRTHREGVLEALRQWEERQK